MTSLRVAQDVQQAPVHVVNDARYRAISRSLNG